MKKWRFSFPVLTFLAGIFVGLSLFAILSFTRGAAHPTAPPPPTSIDAATANQLFLNYIARATKLNDTIKGFDLNKDLLAAMNLILANNSTVSGFRIYIGTDASRNRVGIVVGFDASGKDITSGNNAIYQTDGSNLSPCPPICDSQSPIIRRN